MEGALGHNFTGRKADVEILIHTEKTMRFKSSLTNSNSEHLLENFILKIKGKIPRNGQILTVWKWWYCNLYYFSQNIRGSIKLKWGVEVGDSSVVDGLLKMSKALGSIHSMRKTEGLGKGRMTTFKSIMQDVAFLTVDTRPPGKEPSCSR